MRKALFFPEKKKQKTFSNENFETWDEKEKPRHFLLLTIFVDVF